MKNSEYTKLAAGLTAIGMSLIASGAWAENLPGLVNQNFTKYTGSAPKGPFSQVDPTGWTGGSGLIFIATPNPPNSAAGPINITTYGNPVGNIPGNYVEADGNPTYESGFNYTVTGLTPGDTYTLSFYQGASSQSGFGFNPVTGTNTATTNQWIVALTTPQSGGLQICYNCGAYDPVYGQTSTYGSTDPNASIAASQLMTVPYQGTVGWEFVSVTLKADATTDLLSFLAWGDNGSTVNLPPMAFLSGVDSPPGLVPEPSTWAMMILGFVGLGFVGRRQMKKAAVATA
jgi:PEP-CTERM motif